MWVKKMSSWLCEAHLPYASMFKAKFSPSRSTTTVCIWSQNPFPSYLGEEKDIRVVSGLKIPRGILWSVHTFPASSTLMQCSDSEENLGPRISMKDAAKITCALHAVLFHLICIYISRQSCTIIFFCLAFLDACFAALSRYLQYMFGSS